MQTNRQNKNVRKYVRDDSKYLYVRAESHTHTHTKSEKLPITTGNKEKKYKKPN